MLGSLKLTCSRVDAKTCLYQFFPYLPFVNSYVQCFVIVIKTSDSIVLRFYCSTILPAPIQIVVLM